MNSRTPALLIASTLLLTTACGGRSGALPGGAADGLAPLADGAVGDRSLSPDLLPDRVEGLIYQTELRDQSSGAQQGAAYVFFTPRPMPFFAPTKSLPGGCALYPDEEVGDRQFSAGKVRFSGGPYSFSLSPEKPLKKDSWLYPGILFDDLFSAKNTLTIRAEGDELPTFSGTVQGVDDLKVALPPGNFVRRAYPLSLTFPKGSGTMWVTLNGVVSGKTTGNIRCSFAGGPGSATVATAVLQALPAGATHVIIGAGLVSEQVLQPTPNLKVHLIATNLLRKQYALQ